MQCDKKVQMGIIHLMVCSINMVWTEPRQGGSDWSGDMGVFDCNCNVIMIQHHQLDLGSEC